MKRILNITIFLILFSCSNKHHIDAQNTIDIYGEKDVAIKGVDIISYYKDKKISHGKKNINFTYDNKIWFFSSRENRNIFIKNPQQYNPKYGGFCAYNVAKTRRKLDININSWYIYKGKIYFTHNIGTQKLWLQNIDQNIKLADKNWKKLKRK